MDESETKSIIDQLIMHLRINETIEDVNVARLAYDVNVYYGSINALL